MSTENITAFKRQHMRPDEFRLKAFMRFTNPMTPQGDPANLARHQNWFNPWSTECMQMLSMIDRLQKAQVPAGVIDSWFQLVSSYVTLELERTGYESWPVTPPLTIE